MLAKQTKPSANAGGLRMLFLRPWYKYLVEKKQGSLSPIPFYSPFGGKHTVIHNRGPYMSFPLTADIFPGSAPNTPDSGISAEHPSRLQFQLHILSISPPPGTQAETSDLSHRPWGSSLQITLPLGCLTPRPPSLPPLFQEYVILFLSVH